MPDSLTLEVLRAQFGDCLLLHHGNDLVLIDGGPKGAYDESLKPRLEALIKERGGKLFLPVGMATHIEHAHITGLADMAEARADPAPGPALEGQGGGLALLSSARVRAGA